MHIAGIRNFSEMTAACKTFRASRGICRQRFFAQHIFACPERGDGLRRMQRRRRADVHEFHVGIGQQVVELAINFHPRAEPEVAGFFDVAGDAAQHAVFRQPVPPAHGDDAGLGIFQIGAQMRDAHEAETDDGHVHAPGIF